MQVNWVFEVNRTISLNFKESFEYYGVSGKGEKWLEIYCANYFSHHSDKIAGSSNLHEKRFNLTPSYREQQSIMAGKACQQILTVSASYLVVQSSAYHRLRYLNTWYMVPVGITDWGKSQNLRRPQLEKAPLTRNGLWQLMGLPHFQLALPRLPGST